LPKAFRASILALRLLCFGSGNTAPAVFKTSAGFSEDCFADEDDCFTVESFFDAGALLEPEAEREERLVVEELLLLFLLCFFMESSYGSIKSEFIHAIQKPKPSKFIFDSLRLSR